MLPFLLIKIWLIVISLPTNKEIIYKQFQQHLFILKVVADVKYQLAKV